MSIFTRRSFLSTSSFVAASFAAAKGFAKTAPEKPTALPRGARRQPPATQAKGEGSLAGDEHRGPVCISSFNGLRATVRAMELMRDGYDPADCIVQGVRIIEDDPNDDSVGYGGLPNADGVVELDASVMHGPTHKSGAVGALRNIKNPAMVALAVLRRTDHCLLVGEGALRFAKMQGFREENLLTERARQEWVRWRENMSIDDDYLNDAEKDVPRGKMWDRLPWQDGKDDAPQADPDAPRMNDGPMMKGPGKKTTRRPYRTDVTGTCHCSILDASGDIASCTTTSGLNWKIPGRVGDSPIIGAGDYCDNEVGAAGCTGRGEAAIVNLCAHTVVMLMERGLTPREACIEAAKRVVDRVKEKRLRRADGLPDFDLTFYAIRKDGAYGSASLYSGKQFSVHDGHEARAEACAYLYERKK